MVIAHKYTHKTKENEEDWSADEAAIAAAGCFGSRQDNNSNKL